jgi:hypothetical protein
MNAQLGRAILLWGVFSPGFAIGQIPDLSVKLDFGLTYRQDREREQSFRFYDAFGRMSTVSLRFTLEPGFKATVSQKLQIMRHDADSQSLDEYYVEDEGLWRVGKQYLPFGAGKLLRESALAARGDTDLLFAVPIRAAAVDAGPNRQSGIIGRIGDKIGLSAAIGQHWGINGTALSLLRGPERSPGKGRGWKQAFGVDVQHKVGSSQLAFEYVDFRQGHTDLDGNEQVFDLSASYSLSATQRFEFGISRSQSQRATFYRAVGSIVALRNVVIEPFVRMRNDRFFDGGVTLRFRL